LSALTGFLATGLFLDLFAGGGGASEGIEQAINQPVDIALNHCEPALAIHKVNHPGTTHYCQDVRASWPAAVTRMQPVAGIWFSPDCKEFSKAKGAPVKDRSIRALADEVVVWLRECQPVVAYLENVEEMEYAAPLDADNRPIKGQEGRLFKRYVRQWRGAGYRVEWRVLRACDYGTPTSRKRLFVIMRRDGLPIVWPKATHGHPDSPAVRSGKLKPYRTAAECIDWSKPCPSIFDRDRDLVDATNVRVATGVIRHVVEAAKKGKAFIVPVTHQGGVRLHSLDEPARTITGAHRGELALSEVKLAPHITKYRKGSAGSPMDREMPTVTANGVPARQAGAIPLGMVGATLAPFVTYGQHGGANRAADEPHHTIAASKKDQNCIAVAHLEKFSENSRGRPAGDPLDAVMPGAARHAVVQTEVAFLDRQFGRSTGARADLPAPVTTAGGGGKTAQVSAFLSTFNGSDKRNGGGDPVVPLKTVRAGGGKGGGHHAIIAAHMEQANTGRVGHPMPKPISTITSAGSHQRLVETTMIEEGALPPEMMERATMVAAFLVKYYGEGGQSQAVDQPIDVITGKARFAVVTVTIDAVTYVIVDIGLRMLTPRELARAQGFPDSYILDPECWYTTEPSKKYPKGNRRFGRLPVSYQISAIGNSVCPPVARALVAANQPGIVPMSLAA
jgi:DNA (cytosine-5)-methyltransferase 1